MNHYTTLGVTKTASQDEIKKAFRKLAMQHHPDRGGNESKFKEINEANDILSDPEKRVQYDNELAGVWSRTNHDWPRDRSQGESIDNIWDFINRSQNKEHRVRPSRNKDLRIILTVDLVSTLNKHVEIIKIENISDQKIDVSIDIPQGIISGEVIRYPNLGDNKYQSLPRGDLYVTFRVLPHQDYQIVSNDLITTLQITCFEAIIGVIKEVTGLDKKKFSLTVPPGTQPGTKFRIRDQGLYSTSTSDRGNLIVAIDITIPTMSEEKLEIIRNIQDSL